MSDDPRTEIAQEYGAKAARALVMALFGAVFGAVMVAGMAYLEGRLTVTESVMAVGGTLIVMALTGLGMYLTSRFALPRVVLWAYDGDLDEPAEPGDGQ